MKITTWNVNGIRSLKKDVSCVLKDFNSDIICFQETKVSRSQLPESIAIIDEYSSFFSYPRKQNGYSGVATYCKDPFAPDDAEEEFTFESHLKIDDSLQDVCDGVKDPSKIDFEGRIIITHHLIKYKGEIHRLVVINVYCPRVDPEKPERHFYKLQFCHLLQAKMHQLCLQGCFVVIVGDFNIACSVIDHCDPGDAKEFNSSEARIWFNSFLSSEVELHDEKIKAVDAFRHFYPDKKEAYTCWNTKTGARLTNYGTRIDYIIVSSNLIPLLLCCEILSDYQGSDHCPIIAEFKCEFVPDLNVQLPSICTRLWPEYSGHQQKLQVFFQKAQSVADSVTKHQTASLSQISTKRKTGIKKNKQKSITSFLRNNSAVPYITETKKSVFASSEISNSDTNRERINCETKNVTDFSNKKEMEEQNEFKLCIKNEAIQEEKNSKNKISNEWKFLLGGPPKPPLCAKHKKPCILRTVKKSGPNLGRQFFMCAQPAGSSTNPDANCNFFKWVNPPKVNSLKTII